MSRPRNDWDDDYDYRPIASLPIPGEVFVDEDKADRIPFGFQPPRKAPAMKRTPSRQARVARQRRGIR